MRHKIYIKVTPNCFKQLVQTLLECKGVFEVNTPNHTLLISDITQFNFDKDRSEPTYRIQLTSQNNTKDIFIHRENLEEFTVHFG